MNSIFFSLLVAASFSGWPFILKYGKVSSVWSAILINGMTAFVAVVYLLLSNVPSADIGSKALFYGILGGVINGIGFLVYTKLLSSPTQNTSTVILLVTVLVPICALLFGLFSHERITMLKLIGVVFAIIGIYFITK